MSLSTQGEESTPPVIIGGLGGSGTRVVAEILQTSGVHMGSSVNDSLDSIHFGYVIKPYPDSFLWTYKRIWPLLDLFTYLQFGRPLHIRSLLALLRIAFFRRSLLSPIGGPLRHARRKLLLARRAAISFKNNIRWGWKAPRSQHYLVTLNAHFPGCRYVHVIRHGLDMAFSSNINQLKIYGRYFNIDLSDQNTSIASKQLDFWIRVNRRVLNYCAAEMPGRHVILNYDTLCAEPEQTIRTLLHFLDLPYDEALLDALLKKVAPTSVNRYHTQDLSQFSADQIQAVKDLGFHVEP